MQRHLAPRSQAARDIFTVLIGSCIALLSRPLAAQQQGASPMPAPAVVPLVIEDVTVIDVESGRQAPRQTVVVEGNRVRTVGDAGKVKRPAKATVVDGRGKYLIPGLWDMHVHVWEYPRVFYPLFIANGVTGVRDLSSTFPLDSLLKWRREIMAGTRVGPRFIGTGPVLNGGGGQRSGLDSSHKNMLYINTPEEGRRAVDSLKAAGADFIKSYESMSRETYFAILAEARKIGIPVVGHIYSAITPAEASDSGQRTLEHVRRSMPFCQDLDACQAMAKKFIQNKTWVTPTLVIVALMDGALPPHPERLRYSPHPPSGQMGDQSGQAAPPAASGDAPAWLDEDASPDWEIERRDMRLMHQTNVPMLAGTDADPLMSSMAPGFTLHEELRMMVKAGELTPLQSLQAATINPAKYLEATDSLGAVAPGKLADLVLLDADPLAAIENTAKISAVVANGHFYDRKTLDALMVEAEQAAAQARSAEAGGRQP